jgi:hypothetical protein
MQYRCDDNALDKKQNMLSSLCPNGTPKEYVSFIYGIIAPDNKIVHTTKIGETSQITCGCQIAISNSNQTFPITSSDTISFLQHFLNKIPTGLCSAYPLPLPRLPAAPRHISAELRRPILYLLGIQVPTLTGANYTESSQVRTSFDSIQLWPRTIVFMGPELP